MEILQRIGDGSKKVLIGHPIFITNALEDTISSLDITLYFIGREFYQKFYESLPKVWTEIGMCAPASNLDNALHVLEYREIMNKLVDLVRQKNIRYVLLNSNMWHPKFLGMLRSLGVVLTTKIVDDPEGSSVYSKPIVRFYDKCICSGVDYDKNHTIAEMYYKWGAKDVKFLPVFIDPRHYDNQPIDYGKKDIDIVHVGSFNWKRWISLHRLYRRFGSRVKLYSRYDPRQAKTIFRGVYRLLNVVFPLPSVENISDEELKTVYKRSKIGFNRHLSFGPSNARSYELCLNGVLQVTDNERGYRSLYETGKEIVCYRSVGDALRKIEYYLQHDSEREQIARTGYERASREYMYEQLMEKHLRYILS